MSVHVFPETAGLRGLAMCGKALAATISELRPRRLSTMAPFGQSILAILVGEFDCASKHRRLIFVANEIGYIYP